MTRLLAFLSYPLVLIGGPAAAQSAAPVTPTLTLAMSSDALSESLVERFRMSPPVVPPGGVHLVSFATPTLRAFDASGHELLSVIGYDAPTFLDSLATLTARPATEALTLVNELSHTRTTGEDAVDMSSFPEADYTLVQYGTESCPPCHAEAAVVAGFVADHPELRITWIDVEIDFSAVTGDETPMSDG